MDGSVKLFVAAGAAGATAIAFFSEQAPSRCYYEQRPDGSTDRLARWRTSAWNVPSGNSPVFHLRRVHPVLETHVRWLLPPPVLGKVDGELPAVLVPLCGKAYDMPFLCEQGFGVVGVEGVSRAVHEFREEQRMRVKGLKSRTVFSRMPDGQWVEGERLVEAVGEFRGARPGCVFRTGAEGLGYYADSPAVWRGWVRAGARSSRPLQLIEGDMFEVTPELAAAATFAPGGRFDAAYDRGSLDVIPPAAREEYVAALAALLRPGGRVLLVVLDYDQAQVPVDPTGRRRTPPPFSVPLPEVQRLFPEGAWSLEFLESRAESDLTEVIPAFRGVDVREAVYLITKRAEPDRAGNGASKTAALKYVGSAALAAVGLGVAALLGRGGG